MNLEAAARHLCALRGIDPDALTPHGALDGSINGVLYYSPAWKLAAYEIENFQRIQAAIAVGMA